MPVRLETLSHATGQDHQDLIRLLQDYEPPLPHPLEQWLAAQREAGCQLYVGRFNGRLVAAVWARQEAGTWWLEYLCVRGLTRRRGVATQMLDLLSRRATDQGVALAVDRAAVAASAAPEAIRALLEGRHFTISGEHWLRRPGN